MSVNYDKHSVEKRHNQRFLGIFLMFVVVAVVVGVFSAMSITGYNIFSDFTGMFKASEQAPAQIADSSGFGSEYAYQYNYGNGTNGTNCTDSDGGIEPYVFGIVSSGGKTYSDFCWKNGNQTNQSNATNVLAEFYCWGDKAKRTLIHCPYGCYNGECLNVTNAAINPGFIDNSPGMEIDATKDYGGSCVCYGVPPENIMDNPCSSCLDLDSCAASQCSYIDHATYEWRYKQCLFLNHSKGQNPYS